MADYNALGTAVSDASGQGSTLSGELGYEIAGVFRVVDPDDAKRFIVRFPSGNWVSALHRGKVQQIPGAPVLVGYDNIGRPYIVDYDPTRIDVFLGDRNSGVGVGIHDHVRNSALAYIIDTWLLKQLRMTVSGTVATIAEGSYIFDGALHWYEGGTIDLATHIPSTSGNQRWVIVGIDPDTETLVAEDGTESFGDFALDPADIDSIPFVELGYLPFAAIWLNEGQTSLQNYQIEDLRYPVSVGGGASTASGIIYVPSDGSKWTDPDPTTVQGALDALALIIGAATASATANTLVLRDSAINFATNVVAQNTVTRATDGSTLTLAASDAPVQHFSGTLNQTLKLPDATTLRIGHWYHIQNRSTGIITVQNNAGTPFTAGTLYPSQNYNLWLRGNSTAAGNWVTDGSNPSEIMINKIIAQGITATASSAGTLTLINTNTPVQRITGTTTHTVQLPDATTVPVGWWVRVVNESTGAVTIKDGSTATLYTLLSGQWIELTASTIVTTAGTWVARGSSVTEAVTNKAMTSSTIDGSTSALVHTAELAANAAVNTATASVIMKRDAQSNVDINEVRPNLTSTATAAGTTTLTSSSSPIQIFTGTTTQNCDLPAANGASMKVGHWFKIVNNSTGVVTVRTNGGATLTTLAATQWCLVELKDASSAAGVWEVTGSVRTETLTGKTIAPSQVLGALVEDTAPAEGDYVPTYDVSALDYKKVLLAKIRAAVISNNDVSATPTAVEFALAFPGALAGAHYVLNDNTVGTTYWVTYKGSAQWSYVAMSNATYVALSAYLGGLGSSVFIYNFEETSGTGVYSVNPYISEGRNILLDGDASGDVTAWASVNAATISHQSGWIRVAYNGTGSPFARQTILVIGKAYHITGKCRSNGSVTPRVRHNGVDIFTGTTSTSDQPFDLYLIATATTIDFGNVAGSANYTEFDNLSVTNINVRSSTDYPSATGRLNIVVNTDMDFDYGFSGTNWAWSSGGYVHTPGSTTNLASTTSTVVIGKTYDYSVVISGRTAGGVTIKIGTTGAGSAHSGNGTFTGSAITAAGTVGVYITPDSAFDGKIESISVVPNNSLLIDNGDFAASTNWTLGANWAVAAGVATHTAGATANLTQSPQVIGRRYRLIYTISGRTAGTLTPLGGAAQSANGTFIDYYIATSTALTFTPNSAFDGSIDNVTLVEINPLDAINTGATINQDSLGLPLLGYSFDATNDYIDPISTELNGVLSVVSGHWKIIARYRNISVATDGVTRYLLRLRVDANNTFFVRREGGTANGFMATLVSGGTTTTVLFSIASATDFEIDAVIDAVNNALIIYVNGVEAGRTSTLGTWVGNLTGVNNVIGASATSSPANVWDGYIWLIQHRNAVPSAAQVAAEAQLAGVY